MKDLSHFEHLKLNNLAATEGGRPGDVVSYPTNASSAYPSGDNQDYTEYWGFNTLGWCCTNYRSDGIGGGAPCSIATMPTSISQTKG